MSSYIHEKIYHSRLLNIAGYLEWIITWILGHRKRMKAVLALLWGGRFRYLKWQFIPVVLENQRLDTSVTLSILSSLSILLNQDVSSKREQLKIKIMRSKIHIRLSKYQPFLNVVLQWILNASNLTVGWNI